MTTAEGLPDTEGYRLSGRCLSTERSEPAEAGTNVPPCS